ncbi:hypothetical protein LXL04_032661 [Taraxacum kok-saghyz]
MGKAGKPTVKSSLFEKVLRRRVQETYGNAPPSVDQLVHSLRSDFPEYSRHKLQPFTRMVKQTLDSSNSKDRQKSRRKDEDSPSSFNYSEEDDDTSPSLRSPMRKKSKKIDSREQRLQMLETKHVAQRRTELQKSSESETDDGEEDRSAVSSSEDDVYSLQFEPEIDLTKSMLRNKYNGSKLNAKSDEKPNNVELEVVTNSNTKETEKVDLMKEGRRVVKPKTQKPNNVSNDDGDGKEDGPRFKDIGGMDAVLEELKTEVLVPLYYPKLPRKLGVRPISGILLHGPPGCGKTKLANAIANETGVPFYKISATELVSGISGASEENIRELFSKAHKTAPSIVFIDEIDAIASKRENLQREMERRIVTQLMSCMDETQRITKPDDTNNNSNQAYVLVIGATNRPDAVDPALRRPGRLDREIPLGVPDEKSRILILRVLTRHLKKSEDGFDLLKIARATPGFVGADLAALVNKAGNLAMKRIMDGRKLELLKEIEDEEEKEYWWKKDWSDEEMEKLCITMGDFEIAAKLVQPSSRREGFSSIPNVKWEDVGGLETLRSVFDRYIVRRIKYPEDYEDPGIKMATGFLLYGPPGCGKTLIAQAVANEAGANFIHIKGPEIMSKYVGESESNIRTLFTRARTCAPCVVFFDEVDAVTTHRGTEGGWVVERLVTQLLVELDKREGVYVIGATNRPEAIDKALIRPGRMEKLLCVTLPNEDERVSILKTLARKMTLDADVDLNAMGRSEGCANFSGADLYALMGEATMACLDERTNEREEAAAKGTDEPRSSFVGMPLTVKAKHFELAFRKIKPSVSDKQKQYYDRLAQSFSAS